MTAMLDEGPVHGERAQQEPGQAQDLAAAAAEQANDDFLLDDKYEKIQVVGSGVCGIVYQARCRETDQLVAVKQLRPVGGDFSEGVPAHVIREVSLLRDFVHPNIVQLLTIQITGLTNYSLVFEYSDLDLYRVLKKYRRENELLPMELMVRYSNGLLQGIHACHTRQVMHRDLKPQNILVSNGRLKICDFGLARNFALPVKPYTHDVITLWYRAPEILLGAQQYGPEVDIWSAACIFAEMAVGMPIFPGDSEIGTIFKILRLLGTPTEETWPGFSALEHWKRTFPKWPLTDLLPVLQARPELGASGLALLQGLMCMNPQKRLSARKAKDHLFFLEAAELWPESLEENIG